MLFPRTLKSQVCHSQWQHQKPSKNEILGLPWWSSDQGSPFNAGDTGLIPGWGTKILHAAG